MKRVFFITTMIFAGLSISAQFNIGDIIPRDSMERLLSFSSGSAAKKKLTILDFWSTTCSACMKAFPKIDSLQQEFGGDLQIVLVTKESIGHIDSFLRKHKNIKMPQAPLITSDTALSKMFPHISFPHHVWIDADGRVQYITSGSNLSAKNIIATLKGARLNLTDKSGQISVLGHNGVSEWLESVDYFSMIAPGQSKYTLRASGISKDQQSASVYWSSRSVPELFAIAFTEEPGELGLPDNRIILESNTLQKYRRPPAGADQNAWLMKYSYNYILKLSKSKQDEWRTFMKDDLERYFGIHATIENRCVKTLALVKAAEADKLKTKGGVPNSNFFVRDTMDSLYVSNFPFESLYQKLKYIASAKALEYPVVDLTGIDYNIDIRLSKNAVNEFEITTLRTELKTYALDLVFTNIEMPVLVLRETGKKDGD